MVTKVSTWSISTSISIADRYENRYALDTSRRSAYAGRRGGGPWSATSSSPGRRCSHDENDRTVDDGAGGLARARAEGRPGGTARRGRSRSRDGSADGGGLDAR